MADSRNLSGRAIYGNPNPPYDTFDGDGDPPNGYALVAAPGGTVPADYVARYGLKDRLGAPEGQAADVPTNWDGEPLVTLESGRAVAASVAPPHLRDETLKKHRAQQEQRAGKATQQGQVDAETKAVKPGDVENKSAEVGAEAPAATTPTPAPKDDPAAAPGFAFGKGKGSK